MPPKRPAPSKPSPPTDEYTDEWGIYDPEKAGIPALFKRLGRPVLRAAPTSARRDRRRGLRPERSAEGVGLALVEVRRRAGLLPDEAPPVVAGNPARAMRFALKARAAADHAAVAPYVPPPADPDAGIVPADEPTPTPVVAVERSTPAPARKRPRKAAATEPATAPVAEVAAAPPETVEPAPSSVRTRGRKPSARARGRAAIAAPAAPAAPAPLPAPVTASAPPLEVPIAAAPAAAPVVKAGPPAPSPRRPRGPVPLAAWAHAVADTPREPVRRVDPLGFWRGIFRIPAEVALVEYAHGCRIHRLLVEAGDDHVPEFI